VICTERRRSVGRDEIIVTPWDGLLSHRKLSGMCDGGEESWNLGSTILPEWLCPVAGMFVIGKELDFSRVVELRGMELKATLIQV
jgi:hypothetical protein